MNKDTTPRSPAANTKPIFRWDDEGLEILCPECQGTGTYRYHYDPDDDNPSYSRGTRLDAGRHADGYWHKWCFVCEGRRYINPVDALDTDADLLNAMVSRRAGHQA